MTILYAMLVLGVIAVFFGLILAFAAKAFAVETDPRLSAIRSALAGANCGACGYPGCDGCAEAILNGNAPVDACAPAGAEGAAKIAAILGVEVGASKKMVAHVICNGGNDCVRRFDYVGVPSCLAATKVAAGPTACQFGCLGFGECVRACPFDAIHINEKGVAQVDREKCTNCGACRTVCPRGIIVEVPAQQTVVVDCANHGRGPAVAKVCAKSCIACGVCERTCEKDAIHVVNNVAVIDYGRCVDCGLCTKACPRDAIGPIPTRKEKKRFKTAQETAAKNADAGQ